ncbi:hypothetical protein [Acidianus infernus]|nr:hypothetical protein [Acidianus infernus]
MAEEKCKRFAQKLLAEEIEANNDKKNNPKLLRDEINYGQAGIIP